jgi:hypothetical protein
VLIKSDSGIDAHTETSGLGSQDIRISERSFKGCETLKQIHIDRFLVSVLDSNVTRGYEM